VSGELVKKEERVNQYSFKKKFRKSEEAIPYAIIQMDEHFKTKFCKSTTELDKKGSDINNAEIHIDIKANDYNDDNYIAEWEIKHTNGKITKGNTIDDKKITHYVLWICTNKTYLFDYNKLREDFIRFQNKVKEKYGVLQTGSGSWYADITKVPMAKMKKFILAEFDYTTEDCYKYYDDNMLFLGL
jgi:hypothetical protein